MTNPPYHFFGNGNALSIAIVLTGTFTAGYIGFAIVSLILRDYVKQPLPFIKHEPLLLLLIVSYILAAIGGVSLVGLLRLAFLMVVIGMIPALVFGGCIGLAAVNLAFRDDITFPSLRNKPLRITLYLLITVSSFLSVFLFGVGSAVFIGPSPSQFAYLLILRPIICGSAGFIAATILLRGNMERNLSIAGKIIGVCLLITLGGVLATHLDVPYLGFI